MSSGMPVSSLGGSAIRKPSQTLPAPTRMAARPARIKRAAHAFGASEDAERAECAFVDVARAPGEHGGQRSRRARPNRAGVRAHRRRLRGPASARSRRRSRSGPSPVSKSRLQRDERRRREARMAGACACPVAASRPLGTSSARIGAPLALAHCTSSALRPSGGRERPMPSKPSTTRPGRIGGRLRDGRRPPRLDELPIRRGGIRGQALARRR